MSGTKTYGSRQKQRSNKTRKVWRTTITALMMIFNSAGSDSLDIQEEGQAEDKLEDEEGGEGKLKHHTITKELPTTEVIIVIHNKSEGKDELFRVLLDTGTSRTLGTREAITRAGLPLLSNEKSHIYRTAAGTFNTTHKARIKSHRLLELSGRRIIQDMPVQVTESLNDYDFIFGRDYLARIGLDLRFSNKTIEWDDMIMEMHPTGYWTKERIEEIRGRTEEIGEARQLTPEDILSANQECDDLEENDDELNANNIGQQIRES
jgi:Aspartyl protease